MWWHSLHNLSISDSMLSCIASCGWPSLSKVLCLLHTFGWDQRPLLKVRYVLEIRCSFSYLFQISATNQNQYNRMCLFTENADNAVNLWKFETKSGCQVLETSRSAPSRPSHAKAVPVKVRGKACSPEVTGLCSLLTSWKKKTIRFLP